MNHRIRLLAVPACLLLTCGLAAMPAMVAPHASSAPVAAERSFPASQPRRTLTRESVGTDNQADWGGIESLDVPRSKSQAEKDAESRAASRDVTRSTVSAATSVDSTSITGDGADIARYALGFQGFPYVYGGSTPAGWDCSGFTAYVYAHYGIRLPHQSEAQQAMGTPVSAADARPGDLLWRYGHVGIYLGDGMMIHASTPATGTIVTPVSYGGPYSYYRLG